MISEDNIDIDIIRNDPDNCWNLCFLSCNQKLTVKDIETLKLPNSIGQWEWKDISLYIDIREVRNNPHKPWNKLGLALNTGLTVKDIETLILPNSTGEWDWGLISLCINIQEVINNPNKPWIRNRVEYNEGSTDKIMEFFDASLLKHLQKNIPKFKYWTDIIIKSD